MKIKENYVPKAKRLQEYLHQTKTTTPTTTAGSSASSAGKSAVNAKLARVLPKHLRPHHHQHQQCPQCHQWIPHHELEQHLRIELLDPKWKQQKERELAKKRESNLTLDTGHAVAHSLETFASFRQDIFGGDVSRSKEAWERARQQAAEKSKRAWDGNEATATTAWMKSQRLTSAEDVQMRWEELQQYQAQQEAMQVGPSLPNRSQPSQPPP